MPWILLLIFAANPATAEPCPFKQAASNVTLVGFLTRERTTTQGGESRVVGNFRIIASIDNQVIEHNDGSSIEKGKRFWSVVEGRKEIELMSVGSFLDRLGRDHCVYYGSLDSADKNILFTSLDVSSLNPPTTQQTDRFMKLNTTCVLHGDSKPGAECRRPKLIAVSDIDGDMDHEYWATEPYTWDVGITVWSIKDNKLNAILRTCVGCSD